MDRELPFVGNGHCDCCGRDNVPIHDVMGDMVCIDCLMANIITEEEDIYDEEQE